VLIVLVVSPFTEPFSVCSLASLFGDHATHASTVVDGHSLDSAAPAISSGLNEEQIKELKDHALTESTRVVDGDRVDDVDGVLLVYVWPGVERLNDTVLRV
jgi:hypothetical protein